MNWWVDDIGLARWLDLQNSSSCVISNKKKAFCHTGLIKNSRSCLQIPQISVWLLVRDAYPWNEVHLRPLSHSSCHYCKYISDKPATCPRTFQSQSPENEVSPGSETHGTANTSIYFSVSLIYELIWIWDLSRGSSKSHWHSHYWARRSGGETGMDCLITNGADDDPSLFNTNTSEISVPLKNTPNSHELLG